VHFDVVFLTLLRYTKSRCRFPASRSG